MEILYEGKKYNAYPSDHFAVEEAVCINGITGWIDYTGYDRVVVVDGNDFSHHIMYVNIESVYILYRNGFIDSTGKRRRISPYNWKRVKDKCLKTDNNKRLMFTAKEKNLTMEEIAKALNIKVSDIANATVSHTKHFYNTFENPRYEYSTYEITTNEK